MIEAIFIHAVFSYAICLHDYQNLVIFKIFSIFFYFFDSGMNVFGLICFNLISHNNSFNLLQPLAPICEACGTQRPKIITAKFKAWFCKFCTLENDIKFERCAACDQWRFSYGPPVSASAFNYGT